MIGYGMRKKTKKYMKRMNKLLLRVMRLTERENPVDVCAVCCAVIAITYKHMDDDDRERILPTITACLTGLTGDQKQTSERIH